MALGTVSGWEQITPEIHIQNVERPLFGFFKVPMANNIEPESPLGVSIYSGAGVRERGASNPYERQRDPAANF